MWVYLNVILGLQRLGWLCGLSAIFSPTGKIGLYIGLVYITIGKAGQESHLKEFLLEQFKGMFVDKKECAETMKILVWFFASLLGIIVAQVTHPFSWDKTFEISCIVMGCSLLISFSAIKWYQYGELTETSLNHFFRAMVAVFLKSFFQDPLYTSQLHEGLGSSPASPAPRESPVKDPTAGLLGMHWDAHQVPRRCPSLLEPNSPSVRGFIGEKLRDPLDDNLRVADSDFCRWLDKAAIVEASSMSKKEQKKNWRLFTMTELEEAKVIISTAPLWPSMLLYGLVKAMGSTFFIEQASQLESPINMDFGIISLIVIQSLSKSAISNLYILLPERLRKGRFASYVALIRIGAGLILTVICCLISWRVEVRRLGLNGSKDMSIFWLVPQFCLLGFMEELTECGLQEYISDRVCAPERCDSETASNLVIGLGKLLGAPFTSVLSSNSWFSGTIDQSRFDKYYMVLMITSCFNIFLYCSISTSCKFLRYKMSTDERDHSTDNVEAPNITLDGDRKPLVNLIIKFLPDL
ncbi:protein NRT1/ PTR FAMILY 5.6-like [Telopea speciosissima]|uniref:protein NRT1/ PTR FAMILY 5.6-like n=1 Tax=Telopea speciosissima TaxID=54955 RepID=UPI001CC8143E|nr:protein NRT1/ PTR FAMILY 5.6-like [Telopea speciosissima]